MLLDRWEGGDRAIKRAHGFRFDYTKSYAAKKCIKKAGRLLAPRFQNL